MDQNQNEIGRSGREHDSASVPPPASETPFDNGEPIWKST